jgi:hypothetical protein
MGVGGRERHGENLAAGGAGRRRAVEHELHGRVDDGRKGVVGDAAVEDEVDVDDG